MKKSLKILALIIISLFMIIAISSSKVMATSPSTGGIIATSPIVSNETELKAALNDETITEITLVQGFELASTVEINRTVTIDGKDNIITTANGVKSSFKISNTGDEAINVTFKNVTITNPSSESRCINTRTDKINLTLNKVKLQTTSAQNNQPLTIGGTETGGLKVKMINSSATSAGTAGYGLITFVPADITIENSSITGYAALYVKSGSAGLKVDVINSTLVGENNNTGSDDSFGTIIVEDSNITINVNKNSTIKSTGKGEQLIFGDISTGSVGNKINISSATIDANGEFAYVGNTKTELSVGLGVTSNINIPKEYLPEGVVLEKDENGDYIPVTKYNINVVTPVNGTVTANKSAAIEGEKITITAKPDAGYMVRSILVSIDDGMHWIEGYEKTLEFDMPNEDIKVTVVFEKIKENITIEAEVPSEIENAEEIENNVIKTLKEILEKNDNSFIKNRNLVAELTIIDWNKGDMEDDLVKEWKENFEDVIADQNLKLENTSRLIHVFFNVKDKDTGEGLMPLEMSNQPIKLNVSLLEELPKVAEGYEREFYIVVRNQVDFSFVYDVFDAKLSEDGKILEFTTDKLGLFNITYRDVKKEVAPPAGEGETGKVEEIKPEVKPEEKPTVDTEKTETPDVPQTGDNVVIYAVFAVVAMAGMTVTIKMKRR